MIKTATACAGRRGHGSAQDLVQRLGGQDTLGLAQQGLGVGCIDLRPHGLARRAEFQLKLAKED